MIVVTSLSPILSKAQTSLVDMASPRLHLCVFGLPESKIRNILQASLSGVDWAEDVAESDAVVFFVRYARQFTDIWFGQGHEEYSSLLHAALVGGKTVFFFAFPRFSQDAAFASQQCFLREVDTRDNLTLPVKQVHVYEARAGHTVWTPIERITETLTQYYGLDEPFSVVYRGEASGPKTVEMRQVVTRQPTWTESAKTWAKVAREWALRAYEAATEFAHDTYDVITEIRQ